MAPSGIHDPIVRQKVGLAFWGGVCTLHGDRGKWEHTVAVSRSVWQVDAACIGASEYVE